MIEEREKKKVCPICLGNRFVFSYTDELGNDFFKPCECMMVEQAERVLEESGISKEDIDKKSFSSFDTYGIEILDRLKSKATDFCKLYLKNSPTKSFIVCGQVGAGKTHITMAIAGNLMKHCNKAVLYMPYRDSISRLKHYMVENKGEYIRLTERYKTFPVLLIDDLYKGTVTDADVNILFEIINYRYLNKLPVIVSTEKLVRELVGIDEAIGSRLVEMAEGYTVQVVGKELNHRMRNVK